MARFPSEVGAVNATDNDPDEEAGVTEVIEGAEAREAHGLVLYSHNKNGYPLFSCEQIPQIFGVPDVEKASQPLTMSQPAAV
jgi:hypothetical protein